MKYLSTIFTFLATLCVAVAAVAGSTLVTVNYSATFSALPTNAVEAIPGLNIYYTDNVQELFLTQQAVIASFKVSQKIYLPNTVSSIQPILTFVTADDSKYYWYCNDKIPWKKQTIQNVIFDKIPSKISDPKQFFACSYSQNMVKEKTIRSNLK